MTSSEVLLEILPFFEYCRYSEALNLMVALKKIMKKISRDFSSKQTLYRINRAHLEKLSGSVRSDKKICNICKKVDLVSKPAAKKPGKYALNKCTDTARDIAIDVLKGIPVEEAVRHNGQIAIENEKYDAVQTLKTPKRKKSNPKKINKGSVTLSKSDSAKVSTVNKPVENADPVLTMADKGLY